MRILITGGAGFIGTALCQYILDQTDHDVINIDNISYVSNDAEVRKLDKIERYTHYKQDICDYHAIQRTFYQEQPDIIVHLAAETHTDKSLEEPQNFIQTNLIGTFNMLDISRNYYENSDKDNFRFLNVSTNEVYGTLGEKGTFTEEDNYDPRSPYSASKAGADHLVRAWLHSYKLPILITNCANNYGPFQFPDRIIPLIIKNAHQQKPIPIYRKSQNIRDWIYVEDQVEALMSVIDKGTVGDSYNIGGGEECTNIDLAHMVCDIVDDILDKRPQSSRDLITYVDDSPGHALRNVMDISKIEADTGWKPKTKLKDGLRKTVEWYLKDTKYLLQKAS